MSETKVNPVASGKFKKTRVNIIQKLPDITGLTLGGFHADSGLDIVSGEADIYLCSGTGSLSGRKFLLKYYRRKNALKQEVLEKLKSVESPFVVPVAGYGAYEGHQYAVRPYYEMSALSELLSEGVRFSEEELKTLIIPSVNEGLKAVHDAGILHKDLKPANLIPDDSGEHIVIIDFGISSNAGKNTFVVTETGMTPLYAAPEAMQGIFHKETDYYAFGITVFELFAGFTPFQNPGLSPEEAARLAAISQIEFPENFPEDLKKLVSGLTYKDISRRNEKDNPNRRWGYDEVRRWLNGEDVPVPGASEGSGPVSRSFPPYRFNGITCHSENELIGALLKNPEKGIRDLRRGLLTHHYFAVDDKKGRICEKAEQLFEHGDTSDNSAAKTFAEFLYRLAPSYEGFGAAVFGNGAYEFRNAGEFAGYIDRLDKEGNLYELRHLFVSYREALKEIPAAVWPAAVFSGLESKASGIIQFGELLFRNEAALKKHLESVLTAHEKTPLNLRHFVLDHKSSLESLKAKASLRPVIERLEKFALLTENTRAFIIVDGVRYPVNWALPEAGKYLKFGNYPQNNGCFRDPIEWLVLEVKGNEALLVSRCGLDCRQYHNRMARVTWENCDLRKWLNSVFLKEAFSEDEQQRIKLSEVANDDNPHFFSAGGKNTRDWIFCLSLAEAERYFKNNSERQCLLTALTKEHGAENYDIHGNCRWWLRTQGCEAPLAAYVPASGDPSYCGILVNMTHLAVRPALRLIWR